MREMTELLVSDLVTERERKELVLWGNTEGLTQPRERDLSVQTDCVQRKVPTSILCVGVDCWRERPGQHALEFMLQDCWQVMEMHLKYRASLPLNPSSDEVHVQKHPVCRPCTVMLYNASGQAALQRPESLVASSCHD